MSINNYTIVVPTDGDPARWKQLIDSFAENTMYPGDFSFLIIDNKNAWSNDFELVKSSLESLHTDVQIQRWPQRVSLMDCWYNGIRWSRTDWTFLINDDIVFEKGWDITWETIFQNNQLEKIFLCCDPYNWSGFAVSKKWLDEWSWLFTRINWPAAYYEDDFIYLEMADKYKCKTKAEVYGNDGPICSIPFRFNTRLFEHKHIPPSQFANRWDKAANKAVFKKYWREVSPDWEGAIEAKDGRYYIRNV